MKKVLYGLLLSIIICSCKKQEAATVTTGITHRVTFNVSGFGEKLTNFQTNSTALVASRGQFAPRSSALIPTVGVLYYAVYDSNSNLLHTIEQDSSMSDFGQIADNLVPGTYSVVVVAGHQGLTFASNVVSEAVPYCDGCIGSNGASFDMDVFYTKVGLTVSGVDTTENLTVNRIVGQLLVDVQDAIPANTSQFQLSISDYYADYFNVLTGVAQIEDVDTQSGIDYDHDVPLTSANWGVTNNYFKLYILNTTKPFTVVLSCGGSTATIDNVTCQPNQVTLLTGTLFGESAGSNSSSIRAQVDTSWSSTVNAVNF